MRHLVDPDLIPLIDAFPPLDLSASGLTGTRQTVAGLMRATGCGPGPSRELRVDGPAGAPTVRLLVFEPPAGLPPRPAILYLHGGGMVMGSAGQSNAALWRLVHAVGAVVVSVDYRLAPETPFPGPLEDGHAALKGIVAAAQELHIDPHRIVVMGDSAGGGLAASLALLTRDRGGPQLRGQVLVYPMLDHRTGGPDDAYSRPSAAHLLWTRENNKDGWRALQGAEPLQNLQTGYFSASRAASLEGLPATFLGVGALDLFLAESLAYARDLAAANVPLELHVYPGAPHGFDLLPSAAVATAAEQQRVLALKRFFSV
ncbi:MAG: hypothetical protein RJA98_553 [Pseudomonadota bacterium]